MTPAQITARNNYLVSHYGITLTQYDQILAAQGGVCATCGATAKAMPLNVDHDHATGYVRGLLCWRCNKHVVGAHKDGTLLRAAAAYLDDPPAFAVVGQKKPAPKPRKKKTSARTKPRARVAGSTRRKRTARTNRRKRNNG